MPRFVVASALAAALSLAAVSGAAAWTRAVSAHGAHGASYGRSTSCGGHACSWSRSGAGPHGAAWSRSGSAYCGGGACSISRQGVGPRGYAYDRSRIISR